MTRTLFTLLFCALLATLAEGQTVRPPEHLGFVYRRETVFGLGLHTNRGIMLGYEKGKLRTYYKTSVMSLKISELKHPKEYRQNAISGHSRAFRPFVFGKQNNLIVARAGWGGKRYYSEKARQKGVAMGMSYTFGPSLGLLKPYYLVIRRPDPDNPGRGRSFHEKYSESNADLFLNLTQIEGASPFFKGLSELNFLPGGNASVALHMDWGAFDEFVKALEVGVMLDVFLKKAPILVSEENNRAFLNFFVNLQFGKRR